VENLLNRVIDGTLAINDDVLSFMDDVVAALPEVVEAEAERRQTAVATIPMEARAFDLVGQRPPERVEAAMQALAESASGAEAGSAQETEAEVEEAAHEQGGLRLVGGTSADLEAVEESTEIAQPAEVQEIHAEEPTERALYDVDPELALIFREEVGTHLADIRIFLERCADPHEGGVAVSESVVRSFHTLHGSANMAGVPPIAEISGAAERLLKSLRGSGRRVDALSTALLIEGVDKIAEVLDVVNVSGAAEPDWRKVFEDLNGLWPRLEREALVGAEHKPEAEQEVAGAPEVGTEPTEKKAEEAPAEPPSHVPPAGPEVIPLEDELSSEPAKPEQPVPPAMESVAANFEEAGEPEIAEVAESTDLGFERDPELVATFNEEARDLFEQMEEAYGRWETGDDRAVNDMKRILHTLKGAARLAGIAQIGDLSHAFESMLGSAPAGATPPQAYLGLARRTADRLMEQGDKFAAGSAVPAFSDLVAQLESTAARGEVVEPEAPERIAEESTSVETAPADQPPEQPQQPPPGPKPAPPEQQPAKEAKRAERIRISTGLLDRMVDNVGEVGIYAARLEQQQNLSKFNLGELEQTVQRLRAQLRALEIETEAQILYRYEREGGGDQENPDFDPLELDRFSTIQELSRALAETVDDLANLRDYLQGGNRDAETLLLQQSRIVADLQNELLRTRLIPFTQQVSRLERLVRQTSASMGKRVSLSVAGRETELDRSILEHTIPLVEHLLRNAISHGIESPEERVAEGKPEEGSITLRLGRDGMDVVVTVEDDGKGLDADSIRAKAVEHGAISADQPLDDEDVYNLVTLPGISTASVLTQISGRGVGLDVVANEAKQLGGNLSISSTPGIGSAFTIRLPFTMAITDVLLVKKREDVLAVPHTVVESVVRVTPDQVRACINGDARGIEYAGHIYPLRHISQLFDEPATPLDDQAKWVPTLLVRSGERRMALQVDGVLGTRQIVVKSLGPQLNVVPWLLGGTILADGKVALIVDLNSLVRMAAAEIAVKEEVEEQPARQITVMVVDDSITVRRVTSRLLERHNMNVVTAKDGVEAVALLQDNRPDVMLLDIEMPRMDGFEVARHVRNNQDTAKLPIIMITSRTGEKHRERAKTLGVSQYLGKPYQEDELLDTIFEVLAGAAE